MASSKREYQSHQKRAHASPSQNRPIYGGGEGDGGAIDDASLSQHRKAIDDSPSHTYYCNQPYRQTSIIPVSTYANVAPKAGKSAHITQKASISEMYTPPLLSGGVWPTPYAPLEPINPERGRSGSGYSRGRAEGLGMKEYGVHEVGNRNVGHDSERLGRVIQRSNYPTSKNATSGAASTAAQSKAVFTSTTKGNWPSPDDYANRLQFKTLGFKTNKASIVRRRMPLQDSPSHSSHYMYAPPSLDGEDRPTSIPYASLGPIPTGRSGIGSRRRELGVGCEENVVVSGKSRRDAGSDSIYSKAHKLGGVGDGNDGSDEVGVGRGGTTLQEKDKARRASKIKRAWQKMARLAHLARRVVLVPDR